MDYATEISGSTTQINNIMAPAVDGKTDANAVLASLTPFEQQRESTIGHVINDYNMFTGQAITTKSQVDSVNNMKRYLKDSEGKKSSIQARVQSATKDLGTTKQKLSIELAKQKMLVIIQKPRFALEQLINAVNGGMSNPNGYINEATCWIGNND